MGVFEGKNPAERNKIIAAIVLGTLAVLSLAYTFGGSLIGGSSKTKVELTAPTPITVTQNNPNAPGSKQTPITVPSEDAINSAYTVTPIGYAPPDIGGIGGRNIFAFYEPGRPTPRPFVSPTATPETVYSPPPPTPTPNPVQIFAATPQSKYAGEGGFQIRVNGSGFSENSKIVFNGTPLQTNFVSDQQLTAEVPATFIGSAGFGQIVVDAFDGVNFSQPLQFNIQEPPKPRVEYIGMIAPLRGNNATAYFEKSGAKEPIGKRLNDVVDGRFRVISISENEVKLVDTRLGFRHELKMKRPDPATIPDTPVRPRRPNRRRRGSTINRTPRVTATPRPQVNNPQVNNSNTKDCVPGIPCNLKRAQPRRVPNRPNPTKKDNRR